MKNSVFIVLILSIILIASCASDETCNQTKYVKLTANFYHVVFNDTTSIYKTSALGIDSLTVQGLTLDSTTGHYRSIDSLIYNNKKGAFTINLPLNNFATSSTFKIKFNTTIDTMTIYHANMNDYLSLECGCIVTHSIDTVIMTHHYIDSVKIKIHDVNTINAENIRLYK